MIIANSCAGAFCYTNIEHNLNYKYNNPFIGCGINSDSWYKLLKNFEHIDFNNIKPIIKFDKVHQKNVNYIILDNLVEIRFFTQK